MHLCRSSSRSPRTSPDAGAPPRWPDRPAATSGGVGPWYIHAAQQHARVVSGMPAGLFALNHAVSQRRDAPLGVLDRARVWVTSSSTNAGLTPRGSATGTSGQAATTESESLPGATNSDATAGLWIPRSDKASNAWVGERLPGDTNAGSTGM